MIIYKAYLDYGPYNGGINLGYFQSKESAKNLVTKDIETHKFKIFEVIENEGCIYYRIFESDYIYKITTIEVQP
jgi:hypothetical protein